MVDRLHLLLLATFLLPPLVVLPAGAQEEEPSGAVRGGVYDRDFGSPLPGVRVTLVEARLSALTNEDGLFVLSKVPPGTYTLTFSKEGYERWVLPGIVVTAGRLTDLRADLATEVFEMEEMVVSGLEAMDDSEIAALEIRAESIVLQDSISSELMGKAGASDVGGALKLVVGASVVEGKYATVRGLSDRYTGTTLNGVRVPSADPQRRAVQVDLFPTGTIESISVTKTFTPDLQGDFTGGGVDIRTRSIPDGPVLSVSLAAEHDSQATGAEGFVTYEGGGASPTGAGIDGRGLPGIAKGDFPTPSTPRLNPTEEQMRANERLDAMTRSFEPVLGIEQDAPGYNGSLSAVGGDRYDFGIGRVLGLIGAVTWQHKYSYYEDGQNNTAIVSDPNQGLTLVNERAETRGIDRTLLGVLGKAALRLDDDNEFALELIHNQSTSDEARFQEQPEGPSQLEQNQTLRYIERDVTSVQARGRHTSAGEAEFDWMVAGNYTKQSEPDVRFFRNDYSIPLTTSFKPDNSTEPQNTRRIWRDGRESNYQTAMNIRLPYRFSEELEGFFKPGFYIESTARDYTQNSFTYFYQATQVPAPANSPQEVKDAVSFNSTLQEYTGSDPQDLWSNVFLDPDRTGLARNGVPSPNQLLWYIQPTGTDVDYRASQQIDAGYAMAEIPIVPKLKAIVGARFERTDIEVVPDSEDDIVDVVIQTETGDRGLEPRYELDAATDIRDESWLPSVNLVYEMMPGMILRASSSRTIARPTFRELAPIAQEEFLLGDEFVGNPDLTLSKITNYDLRWEWFPAPGDVLAVSGFYKKLRDPIEYVTFAVQSNRNFISPFNFEQGEVTGWELEGRISLGRLGRRLEGLSIGVNYTKLNSEVEIPDDEQEALASFGLEEEERALQGQPDYIFNANVTYDNNRLGTSAGLFYNLIGEVLLTGASVGASDGNPSVYEQPFGNLDFTFEQEIARGWSVSFKVKNILGDNATTAYRLPSGDDEIHTQYDVSTAWSLGAKWAR